MKYPRGETTAMGTVVLFLLFLLILGGVWVYTGGPERSQGEGPFLNPTWPFGSGGTYGNVPMFTFTGGTSSSYYGSNGNSYGGSQSDQPSFLDTFFGFRGTSVKEDSPYAGQVTLEIGNARSSDPAQEYIVVRTAYNLEKSITISDWALEEDAGGIRVSVGQAALIPFLGQVNSQSPITLPPQSTVYITTGRAPNGTSFRVNQCTGYFEQFQNFYPQLSRECPDPSVEILRNPELIAGNIDCHEFIDRLPSFELAINALPGTIGAGCSSFILNELSYNGCINAHKNEAGFYRNEWRIFLNRDQEVWRNSYERIRLLDENGKVVDSIGY